MPTPLDPATLQAGIQALRDEFEAALRAKGYDDLGIEIRFGSVWDAQINGYAAGPDGKLQTVLSASGDEFENVLAMARAKIAALPPRPTHEDIGRTLGIEGAA